MDKATIVREESCKKDVDVWDLVSYSCIEHWHHTTHVNAISNQHPAAIEQSSGSQHPLVINNAPQRYQTT